MNKKPLFWLRNGHINTIYTSQCRQVKYQAYKRERIKTPDKDFLDIDIVSRKKHQSLIILSHGLEGSSRRPYIQGMINSVTPLGYDCYAWNYRGCSGEPNKTQRFYHSGITDDLELVIDHALTKKDYQSIVLIGFSMGGNITLKYMGEKSSSINPVITKAIAFSTPIELKDSSVMLNKGISKVYTKNFLKTLKQKVLDKKHLLKNYNLSQLHKIKTLKEFDDLFTAPIHGFKGALDYYKQASAKQFLKYVKVPTLLVNSLDDPFLGANCYPFTEVKGNSSIQLVTPKYGGHNGFCINPYKNQYLSESLAVSFLSKN